MLAKQGGQAGMLPSTTVGLMWSTAAASGGRCGHRAPAARGCAGRSGAGLRGRAIRLGRGARRAAARVVCVPVRARAMLAKQCGWVMLGLPVRLI